MLGFKIFDRDTKELTDPLFELAIKDKLALEIALYGDNIEGFTERVTKETNYLNNPNKSIHLNYLNYLGSNLDNPEKMNLCLIELAQAKKLNIKQGVIHYTHTYDYKDHFEQFKISKLCSNLKLLHDIAKEHDFIFHIENTYIYKRFNDTNKLSNYKILWDTVLDLGFHNHIGLCLDWGHVKAFSYDSLTDWLNYAKFLKSRGVSIYMHVHDNDAKKDLHAPLKEGFEKKFYEKNNPKDKPFIELLKDFHETFKNNSLILEYDSAIALDNYLWTKEQIEKSENFN